MPSHHFSPLKPKQMQGSKRTSNDAEGGTLLNPLTKTPVAHEEQPISRGLLSRHFSPLKAKQMQGRKRTINDAEGGTLLNPLTKTPFAQEEQPISQGLLESTHDLEDSNFLESPPKKRWTKNFLVAKRIVAHPHSQESTPVTTFNISENPSTGEEVVHKLPDLSILMPPSRSGVFRMEKDDRKLLKNVSSNLISRIKEAVDANAMIYLSSKAFDYLYSVEADYTPLYNAVCSVICHHYEKEVLAKQKPHPAYDTKAVHDQAALEFSKAEERYTAVNREIKNVQHDTDGITAHLNYLHNEIKKAQEEKEKNDAKAAAVQAVKVTSDEIYFKAKSKVEKIAPSLSEAQKAIADYEKQMKETKYGLHRAMKELSSLKHTF